MKTDLALPIDEINKFCQQWQIIELSLFGSILRDDFHADSDIDILVAFAPTANWGLLDRAQMQEELEAVLSRRVDLISKRAIDRSYKRFMSISIAFQCTIIQIPTFVGVFFLCPCKSLKKKPANYQSAIALPC